MNIHVTTKTQEVAVEILDTDVLYKYILPLGGIQATSIVQSALVGKHHQFVTVHQSADRRSPSVLINMFQVKSIKEGVLLQVPADIVALYPTVDRDSESFSAENEALVRNYFETA